MPAFSALAAVTAYVSSGLVSAGLTATAAASGANLLIGTTLSYVSSLLMAPKVAAQSIRQKATLNESIGERVRGYGRMRIGGTRAFWDAKGGRLYQVIMLHSGRIDGVESAYAGDKRLEIDADGRVTTGQWVHNDRYFMHIHTRVGQTPSPVYERMRDDWPEWTEAHRLDGIASVLAVFRSPPAKQLGKIFPDGHGTKITVGMRLSRVLDVRTGEIAFSTNPALCIRDYLTHADGYRLADDDMDVPSFRAFADICDERVQAADGTWGPRYELGGVYKLTDEPRDTLARMLATADAELYETPEGKIAIRGGAWEEPTVSLTERDILSHDIERGRDAFAAFNELKVIYTRPGAGYQPQEATALVDRDDQAIRGVVTAELPLDMVQRASQARRLAQIYWHKENCEWRGTIRTNLVGLRARGERVVRIVLPHLRINHVFLVRSHGIAADLTGCEIELSSIAPVAYAGAPQTGDGEESPEPPEPVVDGTPVPAGLLPRVETRQITAATIAPAIIASVDAPERDDLSLEAECRLLPAGGWEAMSVAEDSREAVSGLVVDGASYQVRARWLTGGGAASEWSAAVSVAVVVNPTAPAAPSGLARVGAGPEVALTWRNPAANFHRSRLLRGATFDAAATVAIVSGLAGQTSTYVETPGAGAHTYWLQALNVSGIPSPAVSLTTTA